MVWRSDVCMEHSCDRNDEQTIMAKIAKENSEKRTKLNMMEKCELILSFVFTLFIRIMSAAITVSAFDFLLSQLL